METRDKKARHKRKKKHRKRKHRRKDKGAVACGPSSGDPEPMDILPTLIVPDDPETGEIERPKTPPPVEIDEQQLLNNTVHLPVKLKALPNAPTAPETFDSGRDPGSKQPTPRQPTAREDSQPTGSKQLTPRPPTARDELQLPGSVHETPRQPTARDEPQNPGSVHGTPREFLPPHVQQDPQLLDEQQDPQLLDGQHELEATPIIDDQQEPIIIENQLEVLEEPAPIIVISEGAPQTPVPHGRRPTSRASMINSKDYRTMAKRAAATAKLDRLAAGNKSVFDANMNDIAELGIGLQLYFLLIKYLGWAFLVMGIVSLPAIIVNYYGDGVTAKMVDPLQLAYASLGNQGVNPDIASDPTECQPIGDIDCTGATVNTPFTTDPAKVAWIVTASDAIYSFVFLVVYLVFRHQSKRAIETHQNEHLTPAKYTVFVRGLPADATAREILDHFNSRYDPTQEEQYFPLWLGCCWGRRPRRVKRSLSKGAVNCNVVNSLEHLEHLDDVGEVANQDCGADILKITDQKHEQNEIYLGTWIAEVSIAHPTGGLLRTFLAMEALTRKISEAQRLVAILTQEKEQASITLQNWTPPPGKRNVKKPKSSFKQADEVLLQATTKQLERLQAAMTKKTGKLKTLKKANRQLQAQQKQQLAEELAAATALASPTPDASTDKKNKSKPKRKKSPDAKPFDLTACECAFVVFNNLESRRRCLQDYRRSDRWLLRKFQPKTLRFRDGKFPLIVVAAPEPSNILWENLEVTARSRQLRRGFTYAVTFFLLLISGAIISAAQSAQQTFKDKAPPSGLCETTLPAIFYASPDFDKSKLSWNLEWNANATCTPGTSGEDRYYVAYSNGVVNDINVRNPSSPVDQLHRCVDPCVSEKSSTKCNTLACFDGVAREETGDSCETYLASHVLYCLCTAELQASITELGLLHGPRALWNTFVPCRGFLTDFLGKNAFIVVASAVVVIVNLVLKTTLRGFATFERHTSESAKASAVALKMFAAQFLNTAIIVLVVNAALSLSSVPLVGELFRGKYADFQRDWYPTVGMGVTMTMLINAVVPQLLLLLQLCVIRPLKRCLGRRHIRTQERMDKLYAGPTFDLAVRYPMVLNSVFVTLVFCGGSPVLLFIASLACTGTFWLDKLSLLWLYSVKTAYDEALGETVLSLLPWALVAHLGFSSWMYGNTELLQAPTLKLGWLFSLFGLSTEGSSTTEDLYNKLLAKAETYDPLGKHGFIVKVLHANVMLMFVFLVLVVVGILLSAVWVNVLLPLLRQTLGRILAAIWKRVRPLFRCCRCRCSCFSRRRKNTVTPVLSPGTTTQDPSKPPSGGRTAKVAVEMALSDIPTSNEVTQPDLGKENGAVDESVSTATELLVQKSAVIAPESTAWQPSPAIPPADSAAVTTSTDDKPPVSARSAPIEVVLPEFTDYFRKSVGPKFRPDTKLGFKRDVSRPSELVRLWKDETISNGFSRMPGEPMRTWEAIQAPVKTYAIEANAKYRLAYAELVAASKRALTGAESPSKPEIAADAVAVPPVPEDPTKNETPMVEPLPGPTSSSGEALNSPSQ
ncbi:hypothetical protein PHYBOEH_004774 [Phytophthora boehmeriae]|uniref:CSC1/OSCA1-like 7TM region domain-containing protein n=1 Tax=Phytophthora boehmeriae TaxID=109152 RepID=A0A8T1WNE4_9STRA|nr:hypothetical protein PHYBOEH_004774 [Phytophthora boehmeriae]